MSSDEESISPNGLSVSAQAGGYVQRIVGTDMHVQHYRNRVSVTLPPLLKKIYLSAPSARLTSMHSYALAMR